MIGGNQMLAAVFDPFDRPAELESGQADQNVFRIEFPADAEAAADMALVELNGFFVPSQHLRDGIAIPVRHFSRAVQLEDVARLVVARDGAARFQRYTGLTADGKFK